MRKKPAAMGKIPVKKHLLRRAKDKKKDRERTSNQQTGNKLLTTIEER